MVNIDMKRLRLLIIRDDIDSILRELILLGCVEVSEPDLKLDNPEIDKLVSRETVELNDYNTNQEKLALLGTTSTLLLSGWIPASSKPDLISRLTDHVCAWEIEDPSPDELENVPVKLFCPGFFGKMRLGGRRPFTPLR